MTVTMSLELEVGVSIEEISLIIFEFGADFSVDDDGVSGNLGLSKTYFVLSECYGSDEIVTELSLIHI